MYWRNVYGWRNNGYNIMEMLWVFLVVVSFHHSGVPHDPAPESGGSPGNNGPIRWKVRSGDGKFQCRKGIRRCHFLHRLPGVPGIARRRNWREQERCDCLRSHLLACGGKLHERVDFTSRVSQYEWFTSNGSKRRTPCCATCSLHPCSAFLDSLRLRPDQRRRKPTYRFTASLRTRRRHLLCKTPMWCCWWMAS